MIYDAFPFFNELLLLDIKLHELYDVVDKFILVEATRTFTGNPKPLYYDCNKELFTNYHSKIIHVVVEDMPMTDDELNRELQGKDKRWLESDYQKGGNWIRDRFQRNQIMRGLVDADDNDIVIIEDMDEFVRAEVVANLEQTACDGSTAVQQHYCAYYFNNFCTNMPWWGSKIVQKKHIWTPSEVRFHMKNCGVINDSGWHYTFLGTPEDMVMKIKSYAHSEFDNPTVATVEKVEERLRDKVDILGRLYQYEKRELNEHNTPKYIWDNIEKYERFILK
jgi:beta-1,4-mannosyl-glycoprotein beta-1,4-N-acetylglucosaminyltransferase